MKRPWNLPNLPVYSLATYAGEQVNFNICTYVSAVSMQPKLYAVAVYNNTQTLINLQRADWAVLHLLHANQYNLVNYLGKKSGLTFNKQAWLSRKKLLDTWQNLQVLQGAAAYVFLKKVNVMPSGDHQLFLFEVLKYQSVSNDVLTTQELSAKNIIRI